MPWLTGGTGWDPARRFRATASQLLGVEIITTSTAVAEWAPAHLRRLSWLAPEAQLQPPTFSLLVSTPSHNSLSVPFSFCVGARQGPLCLWAVRDRVIFIDRCLPVNAAQVSWTSTTKLPCEHSNWRVGSSQQLAHHKDEKPIGRTQERARGPLANWKLASLAEQEGRTVVEMWRRRPAHTWRTPHCAVHTPLKNKSKQTRLTRNTRKTFKRHHLLHMHSLFI